MPNPDHPPVKPPSPQEAPFLNSLLAKQQTKVAHDTPFKKFAADEMAKKLEKTCPDQKQSGDTGEP